MMRKWCLILLLTIGASLLADPVGNAQTSGKLTIDADVLIMATCKKAEQLLLEGKNIEARDLLSKAAMYDPNVYSANVHELLADVNQNLGNVNNAITEYKRALEFNPKLPSATWNLALAYKDAGLYDDAVNCTKRFLALNPAPQFRDQATRFLTDIDRFKQAQVVLQSSGGNYFETLAQNGLLHPWLLLSLPIRVFVSSGAGHAGFQPVFHDYIIDSLNKWTDASQRKLLFVEVKDRTKANLCVDWTDDPKLLATANGATGAAVEQGISISHFVPCADGVTRIDNVQVVLLTVNPTTRQAVGTQQMQSACLHELGHALGLNGHSESPSDIMFFSQSARQLPALSKRDKEAIARLYAGYPIIAH